MEENICLTPAQVPMRLGIGVAPVHVAWGPMESETLSSSTCRDGFEHRHEHDFMLAMHIWLQQIVKKALFLSFSRLII